MNTYPLPVNVLLVDESAALHVASDQLAQLEPLWRVTTASSTSEALRILAVGDTDAVVAAMHNASADPMELMSSVRATHPYVARVLAGPSSAHFAGSHEPGLIHETVATHVDMALLEESIQRCVALRHRLNDPALLSLVENIDTLPAPPDIITRLGLAIRKPVVDFDEVARIIESDVAITAKLLRLVNSASFSPAQRISNVAQALAYVGMTTVHSLLAANELMQMFTPASAEASMAASDLNRHSLAVAEYAQNIVTSRHDRADAFAAGMLHDIGLLALIGCASNTYFALRHAVLDGDSLASAELAVVGTSHATLGAYVTETWGFPQSLVEAIARSHDADQSPQISSDIAKAVFMAEEAVMSDRSTGWWEGVRSGTFDSSEDH